MDTHLIHVRSRHEDALPLIITHGGPGSVTERQVLSRLQALSAPATTTYLGPGEQRPGRL
jgi:hypothetical protein